MREPWPRTDDRGAASHPSDCPSSWLALLGHYGDEDGPIVFEHGSRLHVHVDAGRSLTLDEQSIDSFIGDGQLVRFLRDERMAVRGVMFGERWCPRILVGPEDGSDQMRVEPVTSVAEVMREVRHRLPPDEHAQYRDDNLVDLATLDSSVVLDLRYATTGNFLSAVFYDAASALLQRPVAEAVVRVHQRLRANGYGLTVFDAYRPWFVTQAFWDATPLPQRWMVADPLKGSKHNRGAAIDVTLHDLRTGLPVSMPSTFDEPTPRAYAFYPGGTTRQRWHRALLRSAMETEGFLLNPYEWWHFDHPEWSTYRINNAPISALI